MAGNPRENVKDKGFWDGGSTGQSRSDQTAGRTGGFPGSRKPGKVGIRTDLEFPVEKEEPKKQ